MLTPDQLAAAAVALIAIVSNVAVIVCLVRTARELGQMRQREAARQREHFWRESPAVDAERRG